MLQVVASLFIGYILTPYINYIIVTATIEDVATLMVTSLALGLTGQFGAGCSTIADYLQNEHSFQKYSLSDIVRNSIGTNKYNKLDNKDRRKKLQDQGNKLRKKDASFLAREIFKKIVSDSNADKLVVIDSIRNFSEVEYLRTKFDNFFLIAIDATSETRWQRVKEDYERDQGQFLKDDMRDKGEDEPPHGQQTELCILDSDIVINNDTHLAIARDWNLFLYNIKVQYLDLMEQPGSRLPTDKELFMNQAYTASLKSSCSKRRVGAVIVTESNYLIASGCNRVPLGAISCREMGASASYCYKDKELASYLSRIKFCPKCGQKITDATNTMGSKQITCKNCNAELMNDFTPGRALDICRAVHAEEAAIIQAARLGSSSLNNSTLYTTTFPCLLCAKSIINSGIKTIVYREPYPSEDSIDMLKSCNIQLERHEGVNPWAFYKLYKRGMT